MNQEENRFSINGITESTITIPQGTREVWINECIISGPLHLPDSVEMFTADDSQLGEVHVNPRLKSIDVYNCPGIRLMYPVDPLGYLEHLRIMKCGLDATFKDLLAPSLKVVDLRDNNIKDIQARFPVLFEFYIAGNHPEVSIEHLDFLLDDYAPGYPRGDYWGILTHKGISVVM
jgi:hypothetical protein